MKTKTKSEMITKDGVRLVIVESENNFWWFNFQRKQKLFGHSDGRGNAQKYYEEVKKYLQK